MKYFTHNKFLISVLLSPFAFSTFATSWYASSTALVVGNGSSVNPWQLQTALNHPVSVNGGDTIFLRGGTYTGNFTSSLTGASNNYITVMSMPGEWAVLSDTRQFASGSCLRINGSWCIYRDFEIQNTNSTRTSIDKDTFRPMGIECEADHTKIINLVIHDTGHGIGFWKGASNSEIYGNIIYNCGIQNSPGVYSTHGHGLYTQNDTGYKIIKHNIIFDQFGFGIHGYPNPGNINNYTLEGNVVFNSGILTDSTQRYNNFLINPYPGHIAKNISLINNITYDDIANHNHTSLYDLDVYLGALSVKSYKLVFTKNYLMGNGRAGVLIANWDSVTSTNNQCFFNNGVIGVVDTVSAWPLNYMINNNSYFSNILTNQFSFQGGAQTNFANWKSNSGFDNLSTHVLNPPDKDTIIIQKNSYSNGRSRIIIFNHSQQNMASIDLSSAGLTNGQQFIIKDIQNYFGNVVFTGTYNSLNPIINVSLNHSIVSAPIGWPEAKHTSKIFNVFEVVPYILTGVNKISKKNNSNIFYDHDSREIKINGANHINATLTVFNSVGELLIAKSITERDSSTKCQLNPGIYFVVLDFESERVSNKIVITY